jgi:hypothetical protein
MVLSSKTFTLTKSSYSGRASPRGAGTANKSLLLLWCNFVVVVALLLLFLLFLLLLLLLLLLLMLLLRDATVLIM